jgi:3-deoxy-D-manno-octulosonic-acid transferase
MQTDEDARRIVAIGASPAKVHVTGNLKYDIPLNPILPERKLALRESYLLPAGITVVTAGSTHQGEEELLLSAYQELLAKGRELLLVLVPRHPERAGAVAELLRRAGLSVTLRSALANRPNLFAAGEVLLVDTVGELMDIYAASDLVFVGGSLVPVGGHNILEPASLRLPVVYGPHMTNFRESAALLAACGGGIQLTTERDLSAVLDGLLQDPGQRATIGNKGARLLEENSGATARQMTIVAQFLGTGR